MLHYLMQRVRTVVNERSTACHGIDLVLDLKQTELKFLVFLSNSSLYLSLFSSLSISVFILEALLMYFYIVQLFN